MNTNELNDKISELEKRIIQLEKKFSSFNDPQYKPKQEEVKVIVEHRGLREPYQFGQI